VIVGLTISGFCAGRADITLTTQLHICNKRIPREKGELRGHVAKAMTFRITYSRKGTLALTETVRLVKRTPSSKQ
jgi:hypothetical protein